MKTKFNKVRLDKGGKSVSFGVVQTTPLNEEDVLTSVAPKITLDKPAHQDLLDCFIELVPHMMFTNGLFRVQKVNEAYYNEHTFLDEAQFEGITVTELQIVGKEDNKIKLIGQKTNDVGDVTPLQSPVIDLEDNQHLNYALVGILSTLKEKTLTEADLYFSKQKYGVFVEQQELEFS